MLFHCPPHLPFYRPLSPPSSVSLPPTLLLFMLLPSLVHPSFTLMLSSTPLSIPLGPLVVQDPNFFLRVVYDLLFFILINVIILNLIFGVIIDTFADLRSEKNAKDENLRNTCFICGEQGRITSWWRHVIMCCSLWDET